MSTTNVHVNITSDEYEIAASDVTADANLCASFSKTFTNTYTYQKLGKSTSVYLK